MASAYHVGAVVLAHVASRGQLDSARDERSYSVKKYFGPIILTQPVLWILWCVFNCTYLQCQQGRQETRKYLWKISALCGKTSEGTWTEEAMWMISQEVIAGLRIQLCRFNELDREIICVMLPNLGASHPIRPVQWDNFFKRRLEILVKEKSLNRILVQIQPK